MSQSLKTAGILGIDGFNAIETEKGALLFSQSSEGRKLYLEYLGLFFDNFYNPLCNYSYFNLHSIDPTDNPLLKEHCDLALKNPAKYFPLQIPIKNECFVDASLLREDGLFTLNSWDPTPEQLQRITHYYYIGEHVPIRGDTFNISVLQEIAEGVSFYRILLDGQMSEFKYEKEFVQLAKDYHNCRDSKKVQELADKMKNLATGFLERDYPDRRREHRPVLKQHSPDEYDYKQKDGPDYYNAIETSYGVLLFSRTKEGKELFRESMKIYVDNFYNPSCNISRFNLHYLKCDNGALQGQCDLALKYPSKHQGFPFDPSWFAGRNVLKYSKIKKSFAWDADYRQIEKMQNFQFDGKFLPIEGETLTISTLQEIADNGGDYESIASFRDRPNFKYQQDFYELANHAAGFSRHTSQSPYIIALRDKAKEILERDYPDIRKEYEYSWEKKQMVVKVPSRKSGRGL